MEFVIPTKVGIQRMGCLDSGFRRNDEIKICARPYNPPYYFHNQNHSFTLFAPFFRRVVWVQMTP